MKTMAAHFSIDGEGFTSIVRNFMLSERPGKAWRIIADGLSGTFSEKDIPKVLDGELKFVNATDTTLKLVRDRAKGYKKTLGYIYAGRVRINEGWWRPKARVTMHGSDDAQFAADELTRDGDVESPGEWVTRKKAWAKKRVEFYAHKNEQAIFVDKKWIIFEMVGEPPFWWDENPNPEEALKQYLKAGRTLDERRHCPEEEPEETVARAFSDGVEDLEELQASKTASLQVRIEAEERAAAAYEARLVAIKAKVLEQANGDVFELKLEDGSSLSVPRAPFENWALGRTALKHLAPKWECVSPVGMKLPLDDPYHTDWLIGSGAELKDGYAGPVNKASLNEMFELQERLGNFECAVLVGGPGITGIVGKDIAVVPDLHPTRLDAIQSAKAVITQEGGKLAHLAQVALERSIVMVRIPDACTRFPEGTRVSIYPDEGKIHVSKYVPRTTSDDD